MSEFKELVLLGYSGHAYVVIDLAKSIGLKPIAYFDFKESFLNPYNLEYFGNENEHFNHNAMKEKFAFPAVGDNKIRFNLVNTIEKKQWKQIVIAAQSSVISPKAKIDDSTLIGPNAVVNSFADIGKGSIINSGSIIEHECQINEFSHIAPGAILAGGVTVGAMTFIGAGAVVKEGIKIGNGVTIGAGSVVIRDIPDYEVFAGNPAKRIK